MPVAQSSHVQTYDYDPATSTLHISFVNGAVYCYSGVTQADADRFAASGSKGTHLHASIIPAYGKGSRLLPPASQR